MKIGFAMRRPSLCAVNNHHVLDYEYRRVESYQEAQLLITQEGFEDYGVSPLLFQKLTLLERNKEFQSAVYSIRERFSIPNDLRYPQNRNYMQGRRPESILAFGAQCMEFDLNYKMPFWLRRGKMAQILHTSTLEYFHPSLTSIALGIPSKTEKSLCISIYSRDISIEQIHEFIEHNRININKALKKLPVFAPKKAKEFERDIRIFDILQANPKISWAKLTDKIAEEFPQEKNSSESTIRMAANRIKKTIADVFIKRDTPLKPTLKLFIDENWDDM